MAITTLGFEARYDVEPVTDGASVGATHQFARTAPSAGETLAVSMESSPMLLRIRPSAGESWVGSFQRGPEGLDGIFATPSAETVCVVAKGQGYWVPVFAPERFKIIASVPIKGVLPAINRNLLLFVDFTRLAAYGPDGPVWITRDLSWDGLVILDITADAVRGTGWDSPAAHRVPFIVDLRTGNVQGGSSPATYEVEQ